MLGVNIIDMIESFITRGRKVEVTSVGTTVAVSLDGDMDYINCSSETFANAIAEGLQDKIEEVNSRRF